MREPLRTSTVAEQTFLICCLIGTVQMTWGTIVPALPLYIERFGATALVLGPIIAAFGVGRVLANIPAGLALRWWRPRRYFRIVCILLVIVTAFTGFSADAAVLIVARAIAGVFGGAAVTIGFAILVAGAPADRRGRVMATATAVQMSAGALGALLGGLVLTAFPLEIAFVVASAPLAVCLLWDAVRPASHYWRWRGPSGGQPLPGAPVERGRVGSAGLVGVISVLAIGSFATFFARFGGEQGLTPVLGYDLGGLTPLGLGLALAAATLVSLAAMPLVGRVIDRGHRLLVLVPGTSVAAGALLVYPLAEGPWLFASIVVLYGLAASAAGVVPAVILSEAIPPRLSGLAVGITRTAGDAGAVVGPLLVFLLFDGHGVWAAVILIAGVLLVSAALLVLVLLPLRVREPVTAPQGRQTILEQ